MCRDGVFCVEGITFNVSVVLEMKKREFVDSHKKCFFLDKDIPERERILLEVYDKIRSLGEKPSDQGIV